MTVYVQLVCEVCEDSVEMEADLAHLDGGGLAHIRCVEELYVEEWWAEKVDERMRDCVHGMPGPTCFLCSESVLDRAKRWEKQAKARKDVGSCDRCGSRLCSCHADRICRHGEQGAHVSTDRNNIQGACRGPVPEWKAVPEVTPDLSHDVAPEVTWGRAYRWAYGFNDPVVLDPADPDIRRTFLSQYGACKLYRGIEYDAGLAQAGMQERDVRDETWIPEATGWTTFGPPSDVAAGEKERRYWIPTRRGAAATRSNL